jgi:hypothetical protein
MEAGSNSPQAPRILAQHNRSTRRGSRRIISPTSYRLDNRNQAGGAKDSDAEEVISRRRKTTSERSQRRERDQFP